MHKIAFLGQPIWGFRGNISAVCESLTQRNFVTEFHGQKSALLVKQRISVFEPPFVVARGDVSDSSLARWKADSRLSIGHNEHFSLALTTEAFAERVGHFGAIYYLEVLRIRWLEAAFGTVCHLTSPYLLRRLFFGTASKLISSPSFPSQLLTLFCSFFSHRV